MDNTRVVEFRTFFIDTNRINSRSGLPYMNQLEIWAKNRVILLEMPQAAQREAMEDENRARTEKASSYICSRPEANTPEEKQRFKQFQKILFPNGLKTQNEMNDVEIVFTAHKNTGILVTNDGDSKGQPGGILGHARELENLGLRVMRDRDAVDYIERKIKERDYLLSGNSSKTGGPLPPWYGKD